jgi:hypothetical protein
MYVDPSGNEYSQPDLAQASSQPVNMNTDYSDPSGPPVNPGSGNGMNGNESGNGDNSNNKQKGFLPRNPKWAGQHDIVSPDGRWFRLLNGWFVWDPDQLNGQLGHWVPYTPAEGDYIGTTVANTDETDN